MNRDLGFVRMSTKLAAVAALFINISAASAAGVEGKDVSKPTGIESSPVFSLYAPVIKSVIYRSSQPITIEPTHFVYANDTEENVGGLNVSLDANESFLVEHLADGSALITIRYSSEDKVAGENVNLDPSTEGELPSQFYLSADLAVQLGDLETVALGGMRKIFTELNPE